MLSAVVLGAAAPVANVLPVVFADRRPLMPNGLYCVSAPQLDDVMPSCLAMSRRISEIVTFSITWSRPRIVSELMTRPPAPSLGAPPVALTCLANPFGDVDGARGVLRRVDR